MFDDALMALLDRLDLGPRGSLEPLSGGDIAAVYRLATDRGEVVLKRDDPERLAGEAEGLRALKAATTRLAVPEVWGEGDGWLVMEALTPARRTAAGERALGEGLRELHGAPASGEASHGWARDNACGATPQPNAPLDDGRAFQRERRLLPLARACHDRGSWTRVFESGLRRWPRGSRAGCRTPRGGGCTATCGRATCCTPPAGRR